MIFTTILLKIYSIYSHICYTNCSNMKDKFDNYLANHDKSYDNNEYWNRLDIYTDNLNYIENHNNKNNNYELGETPFTDISREEFSNMLGINMPYPITTTISGLRSLSTLRSSGNSKLFG